MLDGKFTRGTTPTHVFYLPVHVSNFIDLTVTYRQCGREVIKKRNEDCHVEENIISVTLTQEESLSFLPDKIAKAQLKVLTDGGEVLASPEYRLGVEDIFDDEEFSV